MDTFRKQICFLFIYPKVAGQHLAEYYGKRYVSIGTSVYEGQYNVKNSNGEFGPYGTLKSDDPNSYNYIFGQVKKDQFFIDLRKANGVTKNLVKRTTSNFRWNNYRRA